MARPNATVYPASVLSVVLSASVYGWGIIRVIRSDREYWNTSIPAQEGGSPSPSSTAEFLTFGCAIELIFSSILWGFCWYALKYRSNFERISANRNYLRGKSEQDYRRIVVNGGMIMWSAITLLSAIPYFALT